MIEGCITCRMLSAHMRAVLLIVSVREPCPEVIRFENEDRGIDS